jgi:hypothetical protein
MNDFKGLNFSAIENTLFHTEKNGGYIFYYILYFVSGLSADLCGVYGCLKTLYWRYLCITLLLVNVQTNRKGTFHLSL